MLENKCVYFGYSLGSALLSELWCDAIAPLMVWSLETLMLENKCNFQAFLCSVLASVP